MGTEEDMQRERRQFLIKSLLAESGDYGGVEIPSDDDAQKLLLRALFNLRPPAPADGAFLRVQDEYLKRETEEKGITDAASLVPARGRMCMWQGDITTLRCGAIVNAANSGMTGCYVPNHRCIDNCIHTYAGVQLRLLCAQIMRAQGHAEPTGRAKITPAFNLPCDFVLHTVGPIIECCVTDRDRELLASCYRSCLELAAEKGVRSVAFCCVSTGEFRFPNEEAARIAIDAVEGFLARDRSIERVIFNVFKETDRRIYERLLG